MKIESCGKLRIVLADDNEQMRNAVSRALRCNPNVEILRIAENGAQAVEAVLACHPDILITDIIMPVTDGIQATRRLTRAGSPVRIIFLTGITDCDFQRAAMQAGGQAYVFKSQLFTDLPQAIAAVQNGGTFLSSEQCSQGAGLESNVA